MNRGVAVNEHGGVVISEYGRLQERKSITQISRTLIRVEGAPKSRTGITDVQTSLFCLGRSE